MPRALNKAKPKGPSGVLGSFSRTALGFSQGEMMGLEEWSSSTDILVLCTSDNSE